MSCIASEDCGPTPDTLLSPLAGFSVNSLLVSCICPGDTIPQAPQTISPDSRSVIILSPTLHAEHSKFFILNVNNYTNIRGINI